MLDKLIDSLWTKVAIKQCAEELQQNTDVDSFETKCGDLVIGNNEEVQVKVIVTRKKDEFIGDFEMIARRNVIDHYTDALDVALKKVKYEKIAEELPKMSARLAKNGF